VSHSPIDAGASAADRAKYNDAWSAIYELIDQGHSWSGRERDCCFLNTANERFANISASTGLDYADDGRGLAQTDWDFDGRPDFWVTNRTGPRVRLLHNQTRGSNHFLAVRLQGTTSNRDAIGARVEVSLTEPGSKKLIKTLRSGEGFIGQSTKWLHFGLGDATKVERVVVRWPQRGAVETFTGFDADRHYVLVQGSGKSETWQPPGDQAALKPSAPPLPPTDDRARTWIVGRVPLPTAYHNSLEGGKIDIDSHRGRPLLINLWATTCRPCLEELAEWSLSSPSLADAGLDVVALVVDGLAAESNNEQDVARVKQAILDVVPTSGATTLKRGLATRELVGVLEIVHRAYIDRQQTLPVPCSFLLDRAGRVAAIYKGRVSAEQLRSDVRLLDAPPSEQRAAAVPFPGRWATEPFLPNPRPILARFVKAGQYDQARDYCRRFLDESADDPVARAGDASHEAALAGDVYRMLGALLLDKNENAAAVEALAHLHRLAPKNATVHIETSRRLAQRGQYDAAAAHLETAIRTRPDDLELQYNLALVDANRRRFTDAVKRLQLVVRRQPENDEVRYHLAGALLQSGDALAALREYRIVAARQPDSPADNNLAWILATHPDDSIRDGTEAVRIAKRVCDRTKHQDVSALDTLAASYAEAGQFADALRTIQRAMEMAKDHNDPARVNLLKKRFELYRSNRAYRDDGLREARSERAGGS
jgi:tetratricopeptide (TPR) repeat protein